MSKDSQDVSKDSQDVSEDSQDVSEDSQDVSEDSQDVSEDSQDEKPVFVYYVCSIEKNGKRVRRPFSKVYIRMQYAVDKVEKLVIAGNVAKIYKFKLNEDADITTEVIDQNSVLEQKAINEENDKWASSSPSRRIIVSILKEAKHPEAIEKFRQSKMANKLSDFIDDVSGRIKSFMKH